MVWHFQILDSDAFSTDALGVARGNFSCGDFCTISQLVFLAVEIPSPFICTFCWHSATLVLEVSGQCDYRADVFLCLTLCHLSGSGFGGKLHHSLCGCRICGFVSQKVHFAPCLY